MGQEFKFKHSRILESPRHPSSHPKKKSETPQSHSPATPPQSHWRSRWAKSRKAPQRPWYCPRHPQRRLTPIKEIKCPSSPPLGLSPSLSVSLTNEIMAARSKILTRRSSNCSRINRQMDLPSSAGNSTKRKIQRTARPLLILGFFPLSYHCIRISRGSCPLVLWSSLAQFWLEIDRSTPPRST